MKTKAVTSMVVYILFVQVLSAQTNKMEELKNLTMPLILCCASGNRSGQAQHFLSQHGVDCYNGGSWLDVNYYQSK